MGSSSATLFRFQVTLTPSIPACNGMQTLVRKPKVLCSNSNTKLIPLGTHHSPATHALWEARTTLFENENPSSWTQPPLPKTPSQSTTTLFYNFSSDLILREQYRNPCSHIRTGKLVEDFDALAATIAIKVSNRFYFTFGIDAEAIKNGLRIRNVVPATEEEAQKVLERMDAENS